MKKTPKPSRLPGAGSSIRAARPRLHPRTSGEAKILTAGDAFDLHGAVDWLAAEDQAADKPKRFSMTAYTGGMIEVAGFYSPVVVDLAGLSARGQDLPMLLNHDMSQIVGHSESVDITAQTVKLAGIVSGGGAAAQEVLAAAKQGFPWKASIGARVKKVEYVAEGATAKANGRTWSGPVNIVRGAVLGEVSFCAVPADPKTSVKVAAGAAQNQGDLAMTFDQWLSANGFDPATITDQQRPILQAAWKAGENDEDDPPAPAAKKVAAGDTGEGDAVARYRTAVAGEAERVGKIQAEFKGEFPELLATAIKDGWDLPRVQAELKRERELRDLRAGRPHGPAIHSGNRDVTATTIEAMICRAAGLREVEKKFKPEVLEAADRLQLSGLQDVIMFCARANGYTSQSVRIRKGKIREVLRAAFGPTLQAGFSTVSLPGIFSNIANKFLLDGFMDVEQIWREIAAVRNVSDFKTITSYRMLDDMVFEEVGPTGEIEHGEVGEESYTNRARTYAKMFSLTRQDIINDDLGAFDVIRERIGRGGGIKFNRIFWTEFLDNAAFFTAGRGNLITAVLGEAGLIAAEQALGSMEDGEGNPIDVGGAHILLVPTALEQTARKWYVAQEMRDTTASTKFPTANIYQNKYRPVRSRYITTGYGGAATQWFLVPTGGGDMAPIEVCFLDGVQTPTVESAEADFSTLGVEFRGYWDFGCAKKEWRASLKSAGTG